MNPPKKIKLSNESGSTKLSIKEGNNKKVIKTKKTLGSGVVERTKSVTKYGSKGSVSMDKSKIGSNKTQRKVQGYDKATGGGPTKTTKTGIGSAIAAKKMMGKYK